MKAKEITDEDRALIAEAETLLEELHDPGRHRCSAALRASSGDIYTGINLITGGQADVHSEPVALGQAMMAGDAEIETSVAVIYGDDNSSNPMEVVSACGVCRELYDTFAPDVDIIVPDDDGPVKAPLSELLPAKGAL
jgi:cytidine deaminase